MTQNTTGVPLNVTKDPQCRHSEKQGFVSYASQTIGSITGWKATCSNCGSVTDYYTQPISSDYPARDAKEAARNALMLIEADEL